MLPSLVTWFSLAYWKCLQDGPVSSKHGNLYNFTTCPGYRCYFFISNRRGFVVGDKGKLNIEGGGRARAPAGRWGLSGGEAS